MNIKEAKIESIKAIKTYLSKDNIGQYLIPINRQRPLVYMGPAGIGKTDLARQVAKELNIGFLSYTITHHTRQSTIGLPKLVTKSYNGQETLITEYTMSEIIASIYDYIEASHHHEGILFIDEFNCASETLAATMLQFLQNKTFGIHHIPDGWKIILAGNPVEYNKSVKQMDIVTLDRLRILNIESDFNSWKEYAIDKNIHPCILSYLSQKQSNIYSVSLKKSDPFIVTPRGWEELSHSLYTYEALNFEINHHLILQFINNENISNDFMNFYTIFMNILSDLDIHNILNGKVTDALRKKIKESTFNIQCSITWILLNKLKLVAGKYYEETQLCDHKYSQFQKDALEKKADLESLIKQRHIHFECADNYLSNILFFLKDSFGVNGILELFLNNITTDPAIIHLIIESDNKQYKQISNYFNGIYNLNSINSRMKNIS